MEAGKVVFVTGGVRSGKSSFAEGLAIEKAKKINGRLHYIACGKVTDREMAERVHIHQERREIGIEKWKTWEQPVDLSSLSGFFSKGDILLIDCLTTLLTNEWFGRSQDEEEWKGPAFQQGVITAVMDGLNILREESSCLIAVSNELAFEPMNHSPLVFHYARTLGAIHQRVVDLADEAYFLESGLPLLMKGGDTL